MKDTNYFKEENLQEFLKSKIISNFLDVDTLKFGENKEIYPDRNVLFFEVNGSQYILFYADHIIENDLDFVSDELEKIGVTVKRYIPLKKNQEIYSYTASKKKTPYMYEPILDDSYVCGKL